MSTKLKEKKIKHTFSPLQDILVFRFLPCSIKKVTHSSIVFCKSTVAPAMNLNVRGVTDQTIDLEWEGSVMVTDFLVTYTPSSPGGKYESELNFQDKQHHFLLFHCVRKDKKVHPRIRFRDQFLITLSGVQLEIRLPGNTTSWTISGLEAGMEYNVNVFAVINNTISVPASITVWTCKFCYLFVCCIAVTYNHVEFRT